MSDRPTIYTIGRKDGGTRLDRFLSDRIPALSRTRIQDVIRRRVTVSWSARVRQSTPVIPGGSVAVHFEPIDEVPTDRHVPVLLRGPGWMTVDKPAGVPVHPVNTVRENSLIRLIRRQERCEDLRLCHRLDRETSGVLLLADNPDTARRISYAFERGRVHKEYLAVVRGEIADDDGEIDLPIGKDPDSRVHVRQAVGSGRPSRTRFRVQRRVRGTTVVRVIPETGRRHQIRVHLAALGHPVLGDVLYGRPDADYLDMVRGVRDPRLEHGEPRRQLLHCARIVLREPGIEIDCRSDIPTDFEPWMAGRS